VKWDLAIVARATGGRASGAATIERVVTDSRGARAGDLFVALRGERHNGHDFAAAASAQGAAVLVGAGLIPPGGSGVEVGDTLDALARLAAWRRDEITAPVVAVTGSSGKTTTKDMIAAALGGGAHAAPRSYNNEVGVPLTVLATPDDASAVVVEVGSRGIGHIKALAPAIRPDIAVITNIGPAHLEMFGDVATVLRAKWELVEILEPGGIAVLPVASRDLTGRVSGRLVTFGEDMRADVSIAGVTLDRRGRASFRMSHAGSGVNLVMALAGRHQPINAAAAVGAAIAVGIPFAAAAERAAGAAASPWRMEVSERAIPGGSVVVVNDAYNANPDSMRAAFATVEMMPGRHIAVLGKMQELGGAEAELHSEIGRAAAGAGFSWVIVVGEDPGIAAGAGDAGCGAPDVPAALAILAEIVRPGDVVLIKASRATGLEGLAEMIGGGATA